MYKSVKYKDKRRGSIEVTMGDKCLLDRNRHKVDTWLLDCNSLCDAFVEPKSHYLTVRLAGSKVLMLVKYRAGIDRFINCGGHVVPDVELNQDDIRVIKENFKNGGYQSVYQSNAR